jgi:hypothetical protein
MTDLNTLVPADAEDVGFRAFPLRIQRVELLAQALLGAADLPAPH